jgi:hypothetical protein
MIFMIEHNGKAGYNRFMFKNKLFQLNEFSANHKFVRDNSSIAIESHLALLPATLLRASAH